jgi:3-methylfumaryl-CoA hydratase
VTDPQYHIGRQEIRHDIADSERMARLAAMLDHEIPPWEPQMLPLLGHWLCFRPDARQSSIGPDGHPLRTDGGLLPNVELPRRMWAGSRIRFLRNIPLGAPITRVSTLTAATPKSGRSGSMLFVTLRHEIAIEGDDAAIIEEQDIVYREAAAPGVPAARPVFEAGDADAVTRGVQPDPVMLFRYSALTFNGHRIHYDRDYCREAEGYPSLVIHGPLIATLMLDHLLRQAPAKRVASYSFRAMSAAFEGEALILGSTPAGSETHLRAIGPVGVVMTASAGFTS